MGLGLLCMALLTYVLYKNVIRPKQVLQRMVKNSWISPGLYDKYRHHNGSGKLPPTEGKFRIALFALGGLGDTQTQRRISQMAEELGWEWAICLHYTHQDRRKQQRALVEKLNPHCILHFIIEKDYLIPGISNLLFVHFPLVLTDNTEGQKNFALMSRYDGYFLSPAMEKADAFRQFMASSGRKFFASPGYLSSRRTSFAATPKTKLFFCGDNWDDRKNEVYFKLWRALSDTGYFEAYGPQDSWKDPLTQQPIKAYEGRLPSTADAIYDKMLECGISLVIHGRIHMEGDCPSARIFEAAAASNVIISDELPFTQKHFGDSVLYVDTTKSAEEMFRTIDGHIRWILSHPQEAQELARRSHQIFCEKFALEDFMHDILDLYESVQTGQPVPGSKVIAD
jgi:hypothetical protein